MRVTAIPKLFAIDSVKYFKINDNENNKEIWNKNRLKIQ